MSKISYSLSGLAHLLYAPFVLKVSVTPSEELPLAFRETGHLSLALTICSVLLYCPRHRYLALLSFIRLDILEEPCQFEQKEFLVIVTNS
jgi:hypothetical protein